MPLLRVTLPRACFGLVVDARGAITSGAPYGMAILRRAGITHARAAWQHFRGLGAKCERLEDPTPPRAELEAPAEATKRGVRRNQRPRSR